MTVDLAVLHDCYIDGPLCNVHQVKGIRKQPIYMFIYVYMSVWGGGGQGRSSVLLVALEPDV